MGIGKSTLVKACCQYLKDPLLIVNLQEIMWAPFEPGGRLNEVQIMAAAFPGPVYLLAGISPWKNCMTKFQKVAWLGSHVSGLGRRFLDGLFDSARGKYSNTKFEMDHSIASNQWLSEKFRLTEKRMLT
jgi:hypothetical protein